MAALTRSLLASQHTRRSAVRSAPPSRCRSFSLYREAIEHSLGQSLCKLAAAAVIAQTVLFSCPAGASDLLDVGGQAHSLVYETEARKRRHGRPKSQLPSPEAAQEMLSFDRDLFTDDGWEGMQGVLAYSQYVQGLKLQEEEPGCEQCTQNRLLLEKLWQVVSTEYFDPTGRFCQAQWARMLLSTMQEANGSLRDKRELYTAARHMVRSLHDVYSEFLPPAQFRRALRRPQRAEREYLAAQYTGTGLKVGPASPLGGYMVAGPLAESPAEEAGVLAGERLLEINGQSVSDMTPVEVESHMRGPTGSSIVLTLAEPDPASAQLPLPPSAAAGADATLPALETLQAGPIIDSAHAPPKVTAAPEAVRLVELERRALPQPPLKQVQLSGPRGSLVSYLRLHYFSSQASRDLAAAILEGERLGVDGYILDLRNNPGGVFEEAVASASMLLPEGSTVAATVRSGAAVSDAVFTAGFLPRQTFPRKLTYGLTKPPLVVLVNEGSASASEVYAAALQDNHRATIIGATSFGKGLIQYYFPIGQDGAGLKLTVAKYLTPGGHDISKTGGINPDVQCHAPPHVQSAAADGLDDCVLAALRLLTGRQA